MPSLSQQLLGLSLLALALPACTSPGSAGPWRPEQQVQESSVGAPQWSALPMGWEKLEAVEDWLQSPAAEGSGFWRIEGELALAEGLLNLANQDLKRPESQSTAIGQRVGKARDGFGRVLTDPQSSRLQKVRAQKGQERVRALPAPRPAAYTPPPVASNGLFDYTRSHWGAKSADTTDMARASGKWRYVTIHHSADVVGEQVDGTMQSSVHALKLIQRAHQHGAQTGYADIGYHILIDPEGRVFEGRRMRWQGAHAYGANNQDNIGVCLLGNFENHAPSAKAIRSLERVLSQLRSTYAIRPSAVRGHNAWRATACPGRHLEAWLERWVKSQRG